MGENQFSTVNLQISQVEQAEGKKQMIERAGTKKREGKTHTVYAKKGKDS